MKKGTKGMLIAAGAFAVAGIGFCIGGISVAAVETGGNVFDQAGQLLQDNDYPLAGLIHLGNAQYHSSDIDWDALDGNTVDMDFASDLEISLKYDELLIQEYDGDKIRVNVANDAKNDVVVKETSGKITITDTRSGNVKKKKQIKVIVPSGKDFDTVSLGVDMGTIDLECDLKVQELSVEVGAGEFSGYGNITAAITPLAASSLLVFSLLYSPCVAAIASVKRELGTRWAVGLALWQCMIAWIAALIVRFIGLVI